VVLLAKDKGKITNRNYQKLNNISKRTATIDLKELVEKNLLIKIGDKESTKYSYR